MKRALFALATILFLRSDAAAQGEVSFGVFYSSLDRHGEWVPLDAGVYGWRPGRVVGDWRPYTVGRWAWTSDGWYWVSDEPWGWATYHYGRWYYDDFYGWIWIPGYDWAPAWVEWRYGGDYIGWAPLGPYAVWGFQVGIRYHSRWVTPYHWWSFVDCRHVASPGIHHHVYRTRDNRQYIGRTRPGGNVRYRDGRIVTRGPEREFVERRGRIRLEAAEIRESAEQGERLTREGNRERIEVYRPRIEDRRVDMVEKPSRVREGDRRIDIDVRKTDVRSRSLDRARGKDEGTVEEFRRKDRGAERDAQPMERPRRTESPRSPGTPGDRSVEPQRPDRPSGGQGYERPAPRPVERPRPSREIDRPRPPRKEEMRSTTPERTTTRPSGSRTERSGSGGGGRERK